MWGLLLSLEVARALESRLAPSQLLEHREFIIFMRNRSDMIEDYRDLEQMVELCFKICTQF